jgi:hypothetical protein
MGQDLRFLKWATRCERRTKKERPSTRSDFSFFRRLGVEILEERLALSGNIAITSAPLFAPNGGQPLTVVNVGQELEIQVRFTAQDLPSNASYQFACTVNGLTFGTGYLTIGAGNSGTSLLYADDGYWYATPGTNQVTVNVDPNPSVTPSYTYNTYSFSFTAVAPAVGSPSYTVAQIRAAYGINGIQFGSAAADGSGQTIALIQSGNYPNLLTDLDGFDQAVSLTTDATETLYQQYGPASSIVTVYNQYGTNITANIGTSGSNGVPPATGR